MSLSWRDAVTTLLAAGVVMLAFLVVQKLPGPFLQNPRLATVLFLAAGVAMCIFSGYSPDQSIYTNFMGVLGSGAVLAGIVALAAGTAGWAVVVAGIVVLMWVISTVRHIIS